MLCGNDEGFHTPYVLVQQSIYSMRKYVEEPYLRTHRTRSDPYITVSISY